MDQESSTTTSPKPANGTAAPSAALASAAAAGASLDPEVQKELIKHAADLAKHLYGSIGSHSTDVVVQLINESSIDLKFVRSRAWQGKFGGPIPKTITHAVDQEKDPANDFAVGAWDMWSLGLDGCFGLCLFEYKSGGTDYYLLAGQLIYVAGQDKFLVKTYKKSDFSNYSWTQFEDYLFNQMDYHGTSGSGSVSGHGLDIEYSTWTEKKVKDENLRVIVSDS